MKQFWAIIGIIALVIIGGIIIFAIPWGSSKKAEIKQTKILTDFADSSARVQMFVRGPVVSDKVHQSLKITVGHDSVDAVIFKGYQENVLKQQSFNNNYDAYSVFLSALLNSGFTARQKGSEYVNVPGTCPAGRLYTFEVVDSDDEGTPPSSWTTSCTTKTGTFAGSLNTVRNLFQNQIPDYNKFTDNTDF